VSEILPWELNPALKQERLLTLARAVVETRNKVFAEANRDEGDTNWGLGCRAHERLGHALVRLAESGKHPWLTVHREGLYLMPLVEGVAVRPYRGAADRPGSRHLDALRGEHQRNKPRQMAFLFMDGIVEDGPWYWLMALETDVEGQVVRVVYYQANEEGETRNRWEAPLEGVLVGRPVAMSDRREPEELPPPRVVVESGAVLQAV
jgi:hypothetical protein